MPSQAKTLRIILASLGLTTLIGCSSYAPTESSRLTSTGEDADRRHLARDLAPAAPPAPPQVATETGVHQMVAAERGQWADPLKTLLQRERLFDGSFRESLAARGMTFDGDVIADFAGNIAGGREKEFHSAWRSTFGVGLDLERTHGLKGASLRLSGAWNEGTNLGTDIETIYNPAEIYGLRGARLWELYWGQKLFDDQLDVIIGRHSPADRFNVQPIVWDYVNLAFFSMSLLYNDFAFRSRPIGMWGISSRFDPHDSPFYLVNGLFSGAPRDLQRTSAHGLDFSLQPGKSTLAAIEVGYKAGNPGSTFDLPGTYRGGILYNSVRFSSLSDPADSKRGNVNFYLSADQTLFREPGSNTRGLDGFAMLNLPADGDINLIKFYVAGGLAYTGLLESRSRDRTFVGASYAELNEGIQQLAEDVFHGPSIIPNQSYEAVIEAGHVFQVAPFWAVTPAVQYIINPGLTDDVDNAVVLGIQTVVSF